MSSNLLELLKDHLSGDVVSNLASMLGESPDKTQSALNSALPSLLAGLADKSSDTNAVGTLFNLLRDGNHDGGILSNLGALSRGGMDSNNLFSQGASLLYKLFGDKVSGITDLIANTSGVSKASSSSLLNFLTPVALGLIGKTLKLNNMFSANGLADLLSSQGGFLKHLLPEGLGNLFGGLSAAGVASSLGSTWDNISDAAEDALSSAKGMAEEISHSASNLGSQVVDEAKDFTHSATQAYQEHEEEGKGFLPWILLAAAAALAYGLLKSCSAPETKIEPATPPSPQVVAPAPAPVTPPEPAKVEPTPPPPPPPAEPAPETQNSDFFEKTLATGYAIKAAKDGFESKLITFIEGSDPISKDLWFTMDGITFDTAKATIKAESATQVTHIAEVLKAYPKVKIKIGGYTDNTGKAAANKKLSNNRALAVKKAIVDLGIEAGRVDAEGYGSDHPVASNDTEAGRQQNRRIDVRVLEK